MKCLRCTTFLIGLRETKCFVSQGTVAWGATGRLTSALHHARQRWVVCCASCAAVLVGLDGVAQCEVNHMTCGCRVQRKLLNSRPVSAWLGVELDKEMIQQMLYWAQKLVYPGNWYTKLVYLSASSNAKCNKAFPCLATACCQQSRKKTFTAHLAKLNLNACNLAFNILRFLLFWKKWWHHFFLPL